jgi:hypothetical protein
MLRAPKDDALLWWSRLWPLVHDEEEGFPVNESSPQEGRLPRRPYTHMLGEMGEHFVISHLSPEWIKRRISYDYGLDLNVEYVVNGRFTGKNFSVQVKALAKRPETARQVDVQLTVSTLAYMKKRPEPVLWPSTSPRTKEAYWLWAHEITQPNSADQKTVKVLVPITRKLTQTDWTAFTEELTRQFRARPVVDAVTAQMLDRFGRYSIDLGYRRQP